ncbi:MAG: 30S ribosomal protein S3 [Candidatus Pacebacteria bacterium]|nr:30S ribosomal protein S3 [Candidatus Paceibacterota bacterium]MBP9840168.1 30S ribosomal protein S3 [Candidatus Paceibacterota bacterium]
MTHTVHPYAHRLGIIRDWKSRWFATDKKQFRENLKVDAAVRAFMGKRLKGTFAGEMELERTASEFRVVVHTARPGLVIGRSGENAAKLRKELSEVVRAASAKGAKLLPVKLDIMEIRQPETNAAVVAAMVVEGLEKRMPFRRVLKSTIEKVMAVREVKGARIVVSGRLGGADMSRTEQAKKGRIPLQTFRADVDFARAEANTKLTGAIGVKVWIYLGDKFDTAAKPAAPVEVRQATGYAASSRAA